jgi:hypothetical protein
MLAEWASIPSAYPSLIGRAPFLSSVSLPEETNVFRNTITCRSPRPGDAVTGIREAIDASFAPCLQSMGGVLWWRPVQVMVDW